ncbi:helix-turn-helix domain-containing protein (plasmid) [Natrinema zhouii]|uniref:winged helix-turn-helix domain-containing protein n=1 Tax=Natrinema zhouii TaxID=1710539 RepID=UPI001CFF9655|nr:helix-turn-helix domain-containing protein [Natrinema zhouii]UHQ99026.1 helix-turn-helix domain-containing protein [Natrinema zhouii]
MLNDILVVLADEHRRQLLTALLEHNPQAAVQTSEGMQLNDEQWGDLEVEMYHNHLPRLEEAGFIRWQKEQNMVVKGPEFDQIKPVLELLEENEDEMPIDWP